MVVFQYIAPSARWQHICCHLAEPHVTKSMHKLTDEELKKAYSYWLMKNESKEIDASLSPFLDNRIIPFSPNQPGWLKKARLGLFLSANTVAKKLSITRAAYSKYEDSEAKGAITLATLSRAADAMDCELVYAIRPKNKNPFSKRIWDQLLLTSMAHPWINKCDQKKKSAALVAIARKLMTDAKFRKKQGWSQRVKEIL